MTKNQAKTYIALVALGVASVSEIAAQSKIRREEVYRIIPDLEKFGIVTRQLDAPRKFSALEPETAIQLLIKNRMRTMKEEIDKLEQNQVELIYQLKTIELPVQKENYSIDVIAQQDKILMKLMEMTNNAKQQINVIASIRELKTAYMNRPKEFRERLLKKVKFRIITENPEQDALVKEILKSSETSNNRIELKRIKKIPFKLLIVDDKEAIWGETQHENENPMNLWTNNPTQIAILKMSFESLWQTSQVYP